MLLRKFLRPGGRGVLKFLSLAALRKHQPRVVAVIGDGPTAITREAIYQVLKHRFPTRRNLESPEAEFSIPLTILGADSYPHHLLAWAKVVGRAALQLLKNKPYSHHLILEISSTKPTILNFWLKIIRPGLIVQCGPAAGLRTLRSTPQVLAVPLDEENGGDYLAPHLKTAVRVGESFGIDPDSAREYLENLELPQSRIRFFPGQTKSQVVVDASYYYSPPPLQSVLEITNQIPGPKLIVSDQPNLTPFDHHYQVCSSKKVVPLDQFAAIVLYLPRKVAYQLLPPAGG